MKKVKWLVGPGSMGALGALMDLLGKDAILDPGAWLEPIKVEATKEEVDLCLQLLQEDHGDGQSFWARPSFI